MKQQNESLLIIIQHISCSPARLANNALIKNIPNTSRNLWSSDKERNTDVKFVRHSFALGHSILTKMIAMIWRVDDVRIVQFTDIFQLLTELQQRSFKPIQAIVVSNLSSSFVIPMTIRTPYLPSSGHCRRKFPKIIIITSVHSCKLKDATIL